MADIRQSCATKQLTLSGYGSGTGKPAGTGIPADL